VPVLLAGLTKLLKPANNGEVYNNYVLIPIIAKFLLLFLPLSSGDLKGMYIMLLVGSMLIANTVHILKQESCMQVGSKIHSVFIRALTDSFLQYSIGFIITFMIRLIGKYTPGINVVAVMIKSYDLLYKPVLFLLWACGYIAAYIVLHMIDNNSETPESYCNSPNFKKLGIKIAIGFVLFMGIVLYELNK
jgi:hypothetical protein